MNRAQVSLYVAKAMIASDYNLPEFEIPIDDSREILKPADGSKP